MSESKIIINLIYRFIAFHSWMTENEGKFLQVMMFVESVTKSLGLEDKGLSKYAERSSENICSDNKENLQYYPLKIKDKFPKSKLLI